MKDKWVVVVLEQGYEGIRVQAFDTEKEANDGLIRVWKNDMATEVYESSRTVDFVKSYCKEGDARLYYENSDEPIVYFVESISEEAELSQVIKERRTNIVGESKPVRVGSKLSHIIWAEDWLFGAKQVVERDNVEIIAVGEDFIGIVDENGDCYKVFNASIMKA